MLQVVFVTIFSISQAFPFSSHPFSCARVIPHTRRVASTHKKAWASFPIPSRSFFPLLPNVRRGVETLSGSSNAWGKS